MNMDDIVTEAFFNLQDVQLTDNTPQEADEARREIKAIIREAARKAYEAGKASK